METKYVRIPFEVELAKEISIGKVDGRIITRGGDNARILCFDRKGTPFTIVALIEIKSGEEDYFSFSINGKYDINDNNSKDLMLEIPEYMTFKNYDFKPFDKVLVKDADGVWFADIFSHYSNSSVYKYKTAGGSSWECCIPYNEQTAHLLGTTENYE